MAAPDQPQKGTDMTRLNVDISRPRPAAPFISRIIIGIVVGAIVLGIASRVLAEEGCPPDKPFSRNVVDSSAPVMCTLVMCTGRLHCPSDPNEPCVNLPTQCNTCTPARVFKQCFSQAEMDEARKPPVTIGPRFPGAR
jgi:hypothetical protein